MTMFQSEDALLSCIAQHDDLVLRCQAGEISIEYFINAYGNFYWRYALDGHESNEAEMSLLRVHAGRIEPHRVIAEEILVLMCSEDAPLESYKIAGRIGPSEALMRIREVVLESGSA